MSKRISFDWDYVDKLSKKTIKNFETLDNARKTVEEINKSLPSCWEGVDANTFENSLNNFVQIMRADAAYLQFLGDYFDVASKTIGGTVTTHAEKFTRLDNEVDEKASISRRNLGR